MGERSRQRWLPDWIVLPGETIREAFEERGWTQKAVAERLGLHQSYLSDVIRGARGISPLMALRLEVVTGIAAETWMGLQTNFDLTLARQSREWKAAFARLGADRTEEPSRE